MLAIILIAILILACGGSPAPIQAPAPLTNAPSATEVIDDPAASPPPESVETAEEPPPPPSGGGQPDLVVSEITFDPDPVIPGQPFTINYLIENQGGADARAFTVRLAFPSSPFEECNVNVEHLTPGLPTWGGCVRTAAEANTFYGRYDIEVEGTVDSENEVAESNETNNQMTATVSPQVASSDGGGGQPDLVVTSVTFDPAQPVKGQQFTASFGIKNQGDAASGPFTFRLKFHAAAGLADCNWDGQLGAGEIAWGGCIRQINGNAGDYPVKATIDVESEIAESNEGNNILEVTLALIGN
jgi:hypothetical protein